MRQIDGSLQHIPGLDPWVQLGPGAQVDPGVLLGYRPGRTIASMDTRIGPGARIRSGTVVYAGCTIGKGLETGHGVVIREENEIGDDLRIWNNSTIDYGCKIGHRVRIHCNVYVAQFTVIEDDVFLAPGVMVANDLCPICTQCMKGPIIRRGARIGVNATLLPHVVIGEGTLVGAGSVVTRDLPAGVVAVGSPARIVKRLDQVECRFGIVDRPYDAWDLDASALTNAGTEGAARETGGG